MLSTIIFSPSSCLACELKRISGGRFSSFGGEKRPPEIRLRLQATFCFARFQMVLHCLLQTVQPEYRQLERHKLQLHFFAIFVEDYPELDLKTSLWSHCLAIASNTQPSIWWASSVPASVEQGQPTFFFSFFSLDSLLHNKVQDEVQYLPSDLECCYTQKQHRHQASSLSKVVDHQILVWPRLNLIVFSLGNVSNGGVFCLLWNSQIVEVSTKWKKICGILLSAI